MHLTSHVVGRLGDGRTWLDVLRAAFPAGTLSGAPKIRAMEIIDELEPHRRGVYGGAVGYVSYTGNMDLAIAIRTLVTLGDTIHVQAGAGIVADSEPAREHEECVNKARAVLRAVAMARTARPPATGRRLADAAPHRQLRLVHLEPGPVPRRAGRGGPGPAQRRDHRRRDRRGGAGADRDLAGAVHAQRGRHLDGRDPPVRRRGADPRASASATSASARSSAGGSCGPGRSCTARPRRSSTTSAACSPGSTTRWSRPATTRW